MKKVKYNKKKVTTIILFLIKISVVSLVFEIEHRGQKLDAEWLKNLSERSKIFKKIAN